MTLKTKIGFAIIGVSACLLMAGCSGKNAGTAVNSSNLSEGSLINLQYSGTDVQVTTDSTDVNVVITPDDAIRISLNDAHASYSDTIFDSLPVIKCLDNVYYYHVSFKVGATSYNYAVAINGGMILAWEKAPVANPSDSTLPSVTTTEPTTATSASVNSCNYFGEASLSVRISSNANVPTITVTPTPAPQVTGTPGTTVTTDNSAAPTQAADKSHGVSVEVSVKKDTKKSAPTATPAPTTAPVAVTVTPAPASDVVYVTPIPIPSQAPTPTPSGNQLENPLTEAAAKTLAFAHALIDEATADRVDIDVDANHNGLFFDINILDKNYEYKFEISANDGSILNFSRDRKR